MQYHYVLTFQYQHIITTHAGIYHVGDAGEGRGHILVHLLGKWRNELGVPPEAQLVVLFFSLEPDLVEGHTPEEVEKTEPSWMDAPFSLRHAGLTLEVLGVFLIVTFGVWELLHFF